MDFTGERFLPTCEGTIAAEHFHRYFFAANLAKDKDVLDIASGEGYGSHILAQVARHVAGVDISPEAVDHAREHYKKDNLVFNQGSGDNIPLPEKSVDLAVSFETLEHLETQEEMLGEIKRVLKNDGLLLISTPNRKAYEHSVNNSFHVKELELGEFRDLLAKNFANVAIYAQRALHGSLLTGGGNDFEIMRWQYERMRTESRPLDDCCMYYIALASDAPLPEIAPSFFEYPEDKSDTALALAARLGEATRSLGEMDDLREKLRAMEIDLAKNNEWRAWHEAEIAKKDAELARRELADAEKDRRHKALLARHKAEIERRDGEIAGKNAQLDKKESDLAWAVGEIERLKEIEGWHTALVNSRSWKITAPLRKAAAIARRLKSGKRQAGGVGMEGEARPVPAQTPQALPGKREDQIQYGAPASRVAPKITVVAMARNEKRRAHDTMRHFCALFDRVLLVDHLSDDDTGAIANAYNGVNGTEVLVVRGLDKGYYQSEYMTACARALLREGGDDWIFFLDFDEFLPFRDRAELEQALAAFVDEPVFHMPWNNVAPVDIPPESVFGGRGVIGQSSPEYRKVAINAKKLGKLAVNVEQGNHAIAIEGHDERLFGPMAFGIYHLPVIDLEAFREKLRQGVAAYDNTEGKPECMGYHWRQMVEEFDGISENPELFRELVLHYSMPLEKIMDDVANGIVSENIREIRLDFARVEKAEIPDGAESEASPWRAEIDLDNINGILGALLPAAAPERPPLFPPAYETLEPRARASGEDTLLLALMGAGQQDAGNGGRALNALFSVFRPRRVVAADPDALALAARHMRANGDYGEAVLVLEDGDPRLDSLRHDPEIAGKVRIIRGREGAARLFEPGSIDMLILENEPWDWHLWQKRLAPDSVAIARGLYRDGIACENIGFFDRIAAGARASFRFLGGGGLGVAAFGANNPCASFLEKLAANPNLAEYFFLAPKRDA